MTKKKSKRGARVRQNLGLLPEQHRSLSNDLFPFAYRMASSAFEAARQGDCARAVGDYVIAKKATGELLIHNRDAGSLDSLADPNGSSQKEANVTRQMYRAEDYIIAKCLK